MDLRELKEKYPLAWPEGWPRTRPQDRQPQKSWKKTANQYRDALEKQLKVMDAQSFLISSNVPLSQRGSMLLGVEPLDVGVAVYFSRKVKEDFAWQDVFDLHDPAPTEDQVKHAFWKLSEKYHPEKPGGDRHMFEQICRHRENALNWINRKTNQNFDSVIPCDGFREVRLNMAAIVMALKAFRQLERCGVPSMLERAFKGFAALTGGDDGAA